MMEARQILMVSQVVADSAGAHAGRCELSSTVPTSVALKFVPVVPRESMRVKGAICKMPDLDTWIARHLGAFVAPALSTTSSRSPMVMQTDLSFWWLPIEAS